MKIKQVTKTKIIRPILRRTSTTTTNMMQSEMSDVLLGFSPELSSLGHEEEIENQLSEILLQDFNAFQNFTLDQQKDGLFQNELMEDVMGDTFYPSAKPSDITGQSLAVTMEDDKNKVLNSMAITSNKEATFENKPSMAKDQLPSMESTVMEMECNEQNKVEETQEVIEEMEEFLNQFDDMEDSEEVNKIVEELLSEGQKANLASMNLMGCPLANSTFVEDPETTAAENMIDQLLEKQSVSTLNNTSGYSSATQSFDVSNVSQFIMNGENIIIVVAPAEVQQPMTMTTTSTIDNTVLSSILPSTSESTNEKGEFDNERFVEIVDEDSNSSGDEWLPEKDVTDRRVQFKKPNTPPKNKPGRKKSNASTRSNGNISKLKVTTDRKERKKLQNVEAARRYRDKKKQDEQNQGTEEKQLQKKNDELKGNLSSIEAELATIKKLMTELGLIKLVTPSSLKINQEC